MSIESDLFERLIPDEKKLLDYGFEKQGKSYIYKTEFLNGDFEAMIDVTNQRVDGHVIDAFSEDEYTLFRLPKSDGAYVSKVRDTYVKILEDIAKACFTPSNFVFPQSRKVEARIKEYYGVIPEKNKDRYNFKTREGKSFCEIEYLQDVVGEHKREVMSVRTNRKSRYLKRKGVMECIYPNRVNWISIEMNGEVRENYINNYIEESYHLAGGHASNRDGVKEWIIPSTADFNVEGYFKQAEVFWRQTSHIHVGDIIYVYVGKPYSCILYKCFAKEVDLPNPQESTPKITRKGMIMVPMTKYDRNSYPLSLLKKYGVPYVRGPRYMPEALSQLINDN